MNLFSLFTIGLKNNFVGSISLKLPFFGTQVSQIFNGDFFDFITFCCNSTPFTSSADNFYFFFKYFLVKQGISSLVNLRNKIKQNFCFIFLYIIVLLFISSNFALIFLFLIYLSQNLNFVSSCLFLRLAWDHPFKRSLVFLMGILVTVKFPLNAIFVYRGFDVLYHNDHSMYENYFTNNSCLFEKHCLVTRCFCAF